MRRYLISYDISDDNIRSKIFRMLKKLGTPLQKSVFIADLTDRQRNTLINAIRALLKESDSLFFLPCCERCYGSSIYIGGIREILKVA